MTTLKHHPQYWLRDDAAKAFDSYEDKYGVLNVTDAGRTEAQQQALINRWNQGGAANRPPYLYQPAMPASSSNHVKDGGIAVDIGNYNVFAQHCEEFGFRHTYPGSDPVHFDFVGGGSAPSTGDATVKNEQAFLNAARGEHLVIDGVRGNATIEAIKRYQTFLKQSYGYTGAIDGVWGDGTQAAHAKYYNEWQKPATPVTPSNPFGISDVRGLQKVSNRYGGGTSIDNAWGPASAKGFAQFLRQNWGYSGNDTLGPVMWSAIARWLRAKYGYAGNDVPGPIMRNALQNASTANFNAL